MLCIDKCSVFFGIFRIGSTYVWKFERPQQFSSSLSLPENRLFLRNVLVNIVKINTMEEFILAVARGFDIDDDRWSTPHDNDLSRFWR